MDRKENFKNFNRNSRSGTNRRGFCRGGSGRGSSPAGNRWFRGRNDYDNRGSGNRGYDKQWSRPKREVPSKRLSEKDISVTEYVSDYEGFIGVIKTRYSDFQVSEINLKGEVAKLTDLTPPKYPEDDGIDEDDDLLISKYNLELLAMDVWDRINKLAVCPEPTTEVVEVDVTGMTKEQRTKIHDGVKKAFSEGIVGSTVTIEDKKYVRFEKYRKGVRIDNRVKWIWPGEYTQFILHKENCDTMEAAARIADRLRLNIKPSMLGYAGTKDRRAKTSQWLSLRRVDPRRVAAACRALPHIHVGNYRFSDTQLKLGMLQGNVFRIALRNVTASEETMNTACENVKMNGFLNYYGLQRFGTRIEAPTFNIGLKVLQNDFKGAIDIILGEREGPLQHILEAYQQEGAEAACQLLTRANSSEIEVKILKHLARDPNDVVGAFSTLARNTRLLYLHSYQSLVWNRCATERVRKLGLQPAIGDLVPTIDLNTEETIDEDAVEDDNTSDTEADAQTDKDPVPDHKQKIPVKVLTTEDIESNRYTIFDVILPLPGYNVDYPPNMKEDYEKLLQKDGLNLEMKHKIKCYSMSGAYRKLVIKPQQLEWRYVRYSDPFADLLLSDIDELEGKQITGILEDGKYKALLLTMSLPSSCYATMALREILKVDTSGDNQALQNNYHKKDSEENSTAVGDKRRMESDCDVQAKRVKE